MAKKAHVTSLAVLEGFRSALILYLERANSALDDTRDEVRRTRAWVQQDQRMHWQGQVKRLRKQLEQAEGELFTSRLSSMTTNSAARQMAVTRLRRMVRTAEEKLASVKRWGQKFDSVLDPMLKKMESLQFVLSHDLPKAVTTLSNVQKTLDAYMRLSLQESVPDRPAGEVEGVVEEESP